MTKTLKVKVIAILLMIFTAVGCMFMANTLTAKAEITTSGTTLNLQSFKVVDGASIRLGDGTYEEMGIRFSSELSIDEYYSILEEFTNVEFGTFIMPKRYLESKGAINYENCFGDNAIYYSGETPVAGKTRIHRIVAQPKYMESEGVFYIRGSVINMLTKNLNLEFVGVGYIKAEKAGATYYAFAKDASENTRSVVQVSQNLIDKGGFDSPERLILENYISNFLLDYEQKNEGQAFKTSYKKEFYILNSQNKFVLDESKTEVVENVEIPSNEPLKTVGTEVIPELDGYIALKGLNGQFNEAGNFVKEQRLLKADGSTVFKCYYQEDKGNILFNSSMQNNTFGWSETSSSAGYGTEFTDNWSMSTEKSLHFNDITVQHQLFYGTSLYTFGSTSGVKHAEYMSSDKTKNDEGAGKDGWKMSSLYFPLTDRFSFWAVNTSDKEISIRFMINSGADMQDPVPDVYVKIAPNKVPTKYYLNITKGTGENQVPYKIGTIMTLYMESSNGIYFDNFAWENDLYVDSTTFKATSDNLTVEMGDLKSQLKSTKYSAKELENVAVSNVSVEALSEGVTVPANSLVNNDGNYSFKTVQNNHYQYTATYTVGENQPITAKGYILGYFPNKIADFTKTGEGLDAKYDGIKQNYAIGSGHTAEYWGNGILQMELTLKQPARNVITASIVDFGLDGYALRAHGARTDNNAIVAVKFTKNYVFKNTKEYTTVCFFVYNPTSNVINQKGLWTHKYWVEVKDKDGNVTFDTSKQFSAELGELQPGWNYVEHKLAANDGEYISQLLTLINYTNNNDSEKFEYANSANYKTVLLFDNYAIK